ncbi:hypothetical protein [Caulobacter sp. Root655]|uniref:hypothetical protein n=1 Tax=Caulobacter sp. Root655 TaxID=1736578 RepID=UPI000B1F6DD6|nr:hypothetical protein [Caulobacter sp. Root655]
MGCCDRGSSLVSAGPADPSLHVNYAKGMVLGVDDFVQEFTYLSGRDQWAVRELAGYGVTSGLAVSVEDDAAGPRVRVTAGAAAAPSGQLICVKADQCGALNAWLANPENAALVPDHIVPASLPGAGVLPLYLTLCYADCQTALAPIPGEPCRSEEDLMAPSRVADDYRLTLGVTPPPQTEHDAVADFAQWLGALTTAGPVLPPADEEAAWLAALRAAAAPWLEIDNESPPTSPPDDYMFGSPPLSLEVAPERYPAFLRLALRLWVTELRPLWMARRCGGLADALDDCVLLARLDTPVILVGSDGGTWQVDGLAADIVIDQRDRPVLASLALAQALQTLPPPSLPAAPPGATIALADLNVDTTLDETHVCVLCTGALALTLPKTAPANRGRLHVIKSLGDNLKLVADPADTFDGAGDTLGVDPGKAVTLVSDGSAGWRVLSALA